ATTLVRTRQHWKSSTFTILYTARADTQIVRRTLTNQSYPAAQYKSKLSFAWLSTHNSTLVWGPQYLLIQLVIFFGIGLPGALLKHPLATRFSHGLCNFRMFEQMINSGSPCTRVLCRHQKARLFVLN